MKQASATISLLDGRGHDSAIHSSRITLFKRGLIKAYTLRPIKHRPEADITSMLRHWRTRPDRQLSEKELRCKVVGLFAIVRGGRPSDIASMCLRRSEFAFDSHGNLMSASPIYLRSKGDPLRRGSAALAIPATSDTGNCDFAHTAWAYFKRTERDRVNSADDHFVLTLPRKGHRRRPVGADTIANIMKAFAKAAGVQAQASGFRPAVVTRALNQGNALHQVARLTTHQSMDVLQRHYNRTRPTAAMMTAMMDPSDSSGGSASSAFDSMSSAYDPSSSSDF